MSKLMPTYKEMMREKSFDIDRMYMHTIAYLDLADREEGPQPYSEVEFFGFTYSPNLIGVMHAGHNFRKFDPAHNRYMLFTKGWRAENDSTWFMNHINDDDHDEDICELIDMWEGKLP